jgi:hypothetical protein
MEEAEIVSSESGLKKWHYYAIGGSVAVVVLVVVVIVLRRRKGKDKKESFTDSKEPEANKREVNKSGVISVGSSVAVPYDTYANSVIKNLEDGDLKEALEKGRKQYKYVVSVYTDPRASKKIFDSFKGDAEMLEGDRMGIFMISNSDEGIDISGKALSGSKKEYATKLIKNIISA